MQLACCLVYCLSSGPGFQAICGLRAKMCKSHHAAFADQPFLPQSTMRGGREDEDTRRSRNEERKMMEGEMRRKNQKMMEDKRGRKEEER